MLCNWCEKLCDSCLDILLQSCVIVVTTHCCTAVWFLSWWHILQHLCSLIFAVLGLPRHLLQLRPCFRSLWCARAETRWPWRRCTVRSTCSNRPARVSVAPGSPSSPRARNASTSFHASHSRWSSPSSMSPTGLPTSSARTRTRAKLPRPRWTGFSTFFYTAPPRVVSHCFPDLLGSLYIFCSRVPDMCLWAKQSL